MSATTGRWAADVDRENAELHRLREQVTAVRALVACWEQQPLPLTMTSRTWSLSPRRYAYELRAALGEAQR